MDKDSKIYVAGHTGLVGSAIVKKLQEHGYKNIITRTSMELDLISPFHTQRFFAEQRPEYVFLAAAKVGGIQDNNTRRGDFIYDNIMIQSNVIKYSKDFSVKKLLFLGSSCFLPETMINTINGPKEIKDININELVLTHKNNLKKVYHITKKEINENILEISTNGWNKICCTIYHEIFTKRGFIKANDLTCEDILIIPKGITIKSDITTIIVGDINKRKYYAYKEMSNDISPSKLSKKYNLSLNTIAGWYYKNTQPNIKNIKEINYDLKDGLSKLCGYYMAEGWISGKKTNKRGGKHSVMFSPGYDENFTDDIVFNLKKIFNKEPIKELCRTSYKIGYCSDKNIYEFFEQFYNSTVHRAYTKQIPSFITCSSDESVKDFIKGYWRGDGHYSKRKERVKEYLASCSSVSKVLIYQLQHLLLRFNIHSTIYKKNKNRFSTIEKRTVYERDSWELKITGKYAIYFIENILDVELTDKLLKSKNNDPQFDDNFMYIKIKKLNYIKYIGFVHDLSVEDDVSYTANGFSVHNCIYPKNCPQPIKEEYLLTGELEQTNEPYAIAKITGIKMCESFRRQYGCNFISVMPTNLYGSEYDNYDLEKSHVFAAMIRKIHDAKINGDSSVILWGDGTPMREFLHVDDLSDALVYLMNNYDDEQPLNIGTGKDITIFDLAHKIKDVVGFEGEIIWDKTKPNGTFRKLLDVSKLNKLWKHSIELDSGIKTTYEKFLNKKPSKL